VQGLPRARDWVRGGGLVLVIVMVAFFIPSKKSLHGKFNPIETVAYVKVDGVDYGVIDHVSELMDLPVSGRYPEDHFTMVVLTRDFVTEPSLSDWAKKTVNLRKEPRDITLSIKTRGGRQIGEYVLKKSKPLHWSLETTAAGGFHEKIKFAVQEIAIH
jgi:hypothetical protein